MFLSPDPFDGGAAAETDIAIVGMAGRFPGAPDLRTYWRNLREGVESVVAFTPEELLAAGVSKPVLADPDYVRAGAPLADMEMFDPALFGLSPREAAIMDPQHRHFLECAWEAIEDAGYDVGRFAGPIGVFGGSGHNAYFASNLLTNTDLVRSAGLFLLRHTGNDKDFLTTRVSYLLDLKGPSVAVQTACSTSLVAVHMAAQSLLSQECDLALAGGVTIELPHRRGYLREEGGILSPDGHCRPFDRASQGTVFGSGVGIVVLQRLRDAIECGSHIYAVVKGTAVNNDGSGKVGYLAPSVDGQAHVILEALTMAGATPDTIGYVEAHGTGTPVGDPIEVSALTQAFRRGTDAEGFCAIGSVKGNIGHTDTAAGVAGLIKVALSLHHGELPPTLHYQAPNEACGFDHSPFFVADRLRPWPATAGGGPRRAGVSSLGVGGTNAHVVLQEAPPRRRTVPAAGPHLLVLSAASETALAANAQALAAHLAAEPALPLGDVAYTLQVGRRPLPFRRTLVAADAEEAIAALSGTAPERAFAGRASAARTVAFLFAGGGAQHPGMGRDLYEAEPVYREALDRCLAILRDRCDLDISAAIHPRAGDEEAAAAALERPSIGLPALFAAQYAQASLWRAWGVVPSGMIGHSMGEYVAAHLAGVFDLADALRLVHLRGQLFESMPPGAMLSVPMSADELSPLIHADLSVAAINGVRSTVVSGPHDAIAALRRELEAMETPTALLRIAVAAHSAMLDPILAPFGAFLSTIAFRAPTIPFVSSLTGTWITPAQAQDPAYWVRHLREPVAFHAGLAQLLKDGERDLLEVGPGRVLTGLARQHPDRGAAQSVFTSSRHPDDGGSDKAHMLDALGRLWAVGAPVSFGFLQDDRGGARVPLPTYRFDHQRYWIEPGSGAQDAIEARADPLARRPAITDWLHRPTWRQTPDQPAEACDKRLLLFADDAGVADAMAEARRADGGDAIRVRRGRAYRRIGPDEFAIDPTAPDQYARLLAALAAEGRVPQHVCHAWSVDPAARRGDPLREADRAQRDGFASLLFLAQAIGREDLSDPIDLVVLSTDLQRVCGEAQVVAAKATLLGPCRVIPREYPTVRARSVDVVLPPAGSPQRSRLARAVLAEFDAADRDEAVALRNGARWVQRVERLDAPFARGGTALRQNGCYLVTGGLGGLALDLARHLAETGQARIALVTRRKLPPRAQWLAILAGDADARTCDRIRRILAIEKAGGTVLILEADVTDPVAMRRAVKATRRRFGPIHGVFHTAGVLADGVIQTKDAAAAAATLAPKVRGTLVLHGALAGERPDFTMLFASVSAMLGAAGQVDYAAANAFLDAWAQGCDDGAMGHVVAVDWSQWREIGMAAALAKAAAGLPDDAGRRVAHPLLDRCLHEEPGARTYATAFAPARHWLLDEHRTAGGGALIPGTGFLEIARAAAADAGMSGPVELSDVLFLAPFEVDDGEERVLTAELRREEDGDAWCFALASAGADAGATTVHVRGTIRPVPGDDECAAPLSILAIRARCGRRSGTPDAGPHMQFGPRWASVGGIDHGEGEALIELDPPAAVAKDPAALAIHPALFDMATAGAQALMPGFSPADDFFVPASYGRVVLFGAIAGPMFSHVRLRGDAGDRDVAVYDVTVTDRDGRVLAQVHDFTMVRLRDRALLTRSGRPGARAGGAVARGYAAGIAPAEGMAVVDLLLDAGLGPQVIVSPQDFAVVLAEARAPVVRAGARRAAITDGDTDAGAMTAAERTVAQLFEELLGIDGVGRNDDFFDLGGHSLVAVQFVNKLRKRTGTSLPATALVADPTVAAIAALLDPQDDDGAGADLPAPVPGASCAQAGGAAVLITPGKARTPLFLVHDGLGEILLYRTLATRFAASRPVYGLAPARRADGGLIDVAIPAMAAAHLAKMRRVQPNGPYLVAGLCAGGVIAVEIARQLEEAGDHAAFVGIIDAADVAARERPFFVARARWRRFVAAASGGDGAAIRRLAGKVGGLIAYERRRRAEERTARRGVAALLSTPARAEPATQADAAAMPFLDVYKVAHRTHRPRGMLRHGVAILYRASAGSGAADDMPFFEQFEDEALGWNRRVERGVAVVVVGGGHVTALQEPHVDALARAMREAIDRVDHGPEEATPPPTSCGHAVAAPCVEVAA